MTVTAIAEKTWKQVQKLRDVPRRYIQLSGVSCFRGACRHQAVCSHENRWNLQLLKSIKSALSSSTPQTFELFWEACSCLVAQHFSLKSSFYLLKPGKCSPEAKMKSWTQKWPSSGKRRFAWFAPRFSLPASKDEVGIFVRFTKVSAVVSPGHLQHFFKTPNEERAFYFRNEEGRMVSVPHDREEHWKACQDRSQVSDD